MVRAGSAQHQEPLVLDGHERSLSAKQNRRSHAMHRSGLGRQKSLALGSSPSSGTQKPGRSSVPSAAHHRCSALLPTGDWHGSNRPRAH